MLKFAILFAPFSRRSKTWLRTSSCIRVHWLRSLGTRSRRRCVHVSKVSYWVFKIFPRSRLATQASTASLTGDDRVTVREKLAQTAAELASAERAIDRTLETEKNIGLWQSEIDSWVNEAKVAAIRAGVSADFGSRKAAFTKALRNYLVAFGHSAVSPDNRDSVSLNEQYTPMLNQKRLRSLGSASDQSRLIAAYTLALASASHDVQGLHPGLVVLDEPLQQNPDPKHRERFLSFLSKELAKKAPFQTLIFTSLRQGEISQLRRGGVSVLTPEGTKFLQLTTPTPLTKA